MDLTKRFRVDKLSQITRLTFLCVDELLCIKLNSAKCAKVGTPKLYYKELFVDTFTRHVCFCNYF